MKPQKPFRMALPFVLILVVVGVFIFAYQSGAQKPDTTTSLGLPTDDWQNKVDASVLSKAALGQTEFYIHMTDQADLNGAYALDTKEQKGQYVFDQLTAKAATTQAPFWCAVIITR